tara:strand:- start:242 stop:745 length:504 start_codon:yes stop_codon:yes gene_type:complete
MLSGMISSVGGQLKFPATQIVSSDPNTLDDYEEGSIPISAFKTNGTALSSSSGMDLAPSKYIKIGSMVHLQIGFDSNGVNLNDTGTFGGGGNGELEVILPFAVASNITFRGASAMGYNGSANIQLFWNLSGTTDLISFYTDAALATTFDCSGTGRRMIFINLTYSVL